ncbi:MAG: hypothetical protein WCD85_20110, partial [Pantoea agglomerans]
MSLQLPDGANLEFARKQAKQLLRQLRAAEPAALALAREFHPKMDEADPAGRGWQLSDAQLILARQYGQPSWMKLRQAIEQLRPLAEQARAFVDSMFGWQDGRFMDILASNPAVAGYDFICRLLCGEHEELATLLAKDPDAAKRKFAPLDRELILYVSYSMMHQAGSQYRSGLLRCMELLLEAGADPNAAYDEGGTWA